MLLQDKIIEIFVQVDDFDNEFEVEFKILQLPSPRVLKPVIEKLVCVAMK